MRLSRKQMIEFADKIGACEHWKELLRHGTMRQIRRAFSANFLDAQDEAAFELGFNVVLWRTFPWGFANISCWDIERSVLSMFPLEVWEEAILIYLGAIE